MAKPAIPFELVPMKQVPVKPPIYDQPSAKRGSQWDAALTALERNPDMAIRVTEASSAKRRTLKSTITIMAHNRAIEIEVRDDGRNYVFGFLKERGGRYYDPSSN